MFVLANFFCMVSLLQWIQSVSIAYGAIYTQKDDAGSNGGTLENGAEILNNFLFYLGPG